MPFTYLDRDGTELQGWKTVSFDAYRSAYPKHHTQSGVLEIMAMQSLLVACTSQDKYQEQVFPLLHTPVVIARSNASTVFEAVSSADPSWNAQTLKEDRIILLF